ncbi:MAG: hypothetical protein ACR2IC_02115 [Candidatus Methylopumilus sp.]
MKKLLPLFVLLILFGCATTDNLGDLSKRFEEIKKIETLLFNQMPLPKDARISPDKSLILGEGDNWAGRIELSSSMEPLEASAFFTTEYPKHNWQLISSTKAKLSILVFTSNSRTLTLEITEGGPLAAKSMIVMTVAPKVQNQTLPDSKK